MTQDQLRKVGRGGAGNFYSAPSKEAEADLEAQTAEDTGTAPSSTVPSAARAGRGGAGNFINPQDAQANEADVAASTMEAVRQEPSAPRAGGYAGRGGAGNWKAKKEADGEERDAEGNHDIEHKVKEAVEHGLKMPEKVHHALEKTRDH
ncbi:uncharacterized protein F5Z01DRAFT_671723 [Emericellopsis atlantica]|uniref:Uncharacterized protein n=1 Tax=Emericellopsis atlantica TaxID=2614577 RepID=A0A9P7ZTA3_9HYPO|nr:uncharacterized protein F5Z01DRAFT_671723 [Emericellopsis atlantica]KAG9257285.1 hypothetical protein F5Z01DRAFT_671723 [Emericellopsis atlantica]